MGEIIEYLFGAASFVPHGYCLLWRPDLVAMHALSDAVIAVSYLSIPMALAVFVRRRVDLEYKWVFWLFAAFIVACGTTHLVGLVTLWQPVYGLQGLIKIATAGVSVATAFLLWPLIPKALALPSPSALREANAELEEALIAKDRALRQINALLDSAPDATIFVDRAGTIVRTNRQTERLLGYSAGELTNKPVGMLLPELCPEYFFGERATGLTATEPEPFAMAKDGRKIPVEISRNPIETDRDYVVCAALRDVTERKRAELALAERNTQFELASNAARVGSFSVDLSTGRVKLTLGCAALYGLPEGTVEMSRDDARKLVHQEDLPQLELQSGQIVIAQQREFSAQFRIVRADDGEVRWVETRNLIFYDQNDKPSQLIGISIDFTERKRAEQALVERNILLALAGRTARVGTFAYDTDKEILQISEDYAAIHGL